MTLIQPLAVVCLKTNKDTFIYGIRSIQYSGARLWNTLPVPIKDSQSASVFRLQVKALFLSHYMEDGCSTNELIVPPAGYSLFSTLGIVVGVGCVLQVG